MKKYIITEEDIERLIDTFNYNEFDLLRVYEWKESLEELSKIAEEWAIRELDKSAAKKELEKDFINSAILDIESTYKVDKALEDSLQYFNSLYKDVTVTYENESFIIEGNSEHTKEIEKIIKNMIEFSKK